ncbi:hypothetical protein [Chitinibacter tainanensis]|uniref:hypothetical protein n=1 Tax=Chitinibacter tainanensis TaxID=230667 RepID=UPI00041B1EAF|nr:hypothetical protein [Chitinibacter tainanensis]
MSYSQEQISTISKRRHPEYAKLIKHWGFLRETYEGGREWFKKHIFTYHKEGKHEFRQRIARAYRFNHTKEVSDLVNKYLFKKLPERATDAPEFVKAFWKSVNGSGLGIDEFMRQGSLLSSIGGRVAIVVDSRVGAETPKPANLAEEKQLGNTVYAYFVSVEDILDFAWDEAGELSWVLLREHGRDDADPFTSSGLVHERFRLWTKNNWYLIKPELDSKGAPTGNFTVDGGEVSIGKVPVVFLDHMISHVRSYSSPGLIDDIAYLDRAVANYLSNLDAIIQDQTFSQLVMPAQGLLPGDEGYSKLVDAGTKRVFTYDGEHGGEPKYISPDAKQANVILDVISKIINEIYHSVGLAGERTKSDNSMGIDNSSGVAKAFDFERVNALLVSKADALELAENQICRLVSAYHSKEVSENLVTYPETFDTRGLVDELDIATRLQDLDAPDELRRHQLERLVDKLYPQLSVVKRKKIIDAIEKDWPKSLVSLPGFGGKSGPADGLDPRPLGQGSNQQGSSTVENNGS